MIVPPERHWPAVTLVTPDPVPPPIDGGVIVCPKTDTAAHTRTAIVFRFIESEILRSRMKDMENKRSETAQ
jgi:hypothetical protein